MKHIDLQSLLIGALLTSTIIFGVAAFPPKDTGVFWNVHHVWDDKQEWEANDRGGAGFEPFAMSGDTIIYRKRIK